MRLSSAKQSQAAISYFDGHSIDTVGASCSALANAMMVGCVATRVPCRKEFENPLMPSDDSDMTERRDTIDMSNPRLK